MAHKEQEWAAKRRFIQNEIDHIKAEKEKIDHEKREKFRKITDLEDQKKQIESQLHRLRN